MMFNDEYMEWPGSVYSAKEFFSPTNLVLLPDSYLRLSRHQGKDVWDAGGKCLIDLMMDAMGKFEVVFGSVGCTDSRVLETMGAMRVENQRVVAFQDKPSNGLDMFNCFWGCYGFRREVGKPLYDFLIRSVRHQGAALKEQGFYPPGAVPVGVYYDLGTWERIAEFKSSMASSSINL
ncbi:MAG: hypothetical protein GY940_16830 [bacterium]|nr:hypothetical protein [bacterium]